MLLAAYLRMSSIFVLSTKDGPVNTGPPSAEVTGHTPPPAAGRRDPPEIPDTEEVTGSNPVAPTHCVDQVFRMRARLAAG